MPVLTGQLGLEEERKLCLVKEENYLLNEINISARPLVDLSSCFLHICFH